MLNNITYFHRSVISKVEFVTHEEVLEVDAFSTAGLHPDFEEFGGRIWKKTSDSANLVEYVSLSEDFYFDRIVFNFEDFATVNKQTLNQTPECFGDIENPMEVYRILYTTKRSEEEVEVSKAIKAILEYSSMEELRYELEALKYEVSKKTKNVISKIITAL